MEFAGNAYCGVGHYLNHTWTDKTKGFKATYEIYDKASDTEGYIGYLPSDNSIYVVFRGSSSIKNWVSNFDATHATYRKWPECDCNVHKGFQNAYESVYTHVLKEVHALQKTYPTAAVKVTGHSLGAALAQLTGMGLIRDGVPVSMYNFGQPRTGDDKYAAFVGKKMTNAFRVTHYKDEVPHIPPTFPIQYHHTKTEYYENQNGSVKKCNGSGEDPSCADQWNQLQCNVDDHMTYLGVYLQCGAHATLTDGFLQ